MHYLSNGHSPLSRRSPTSGDEVMIYGDGLNASASMRDDYEKEDSLDMEVVSGRLLVYEDSRSMLVDIPLTEQNMDSVGSAIKAHGDTILEGFARTGAGFHL